MSMERKDRVTYVVHIRIEKTTQSSTVDSYTKEITLGAKVTEEVVNTVIKTGTVAQLRTAANSSLDVALDSVGETE